MFAAMEARLEKLLERCIRESVSARQKAAGLEGRSLRVCVDGLGLDLTAAVRDGRVRLSRGSSGDADVTVRGTPLDLVRLIGPDIASRLPRSNVDVKGRLHLAEDFAALFRFALPDPEEELARWIGDIAAHRIGESFRRAATWASSAARSLREDTTDYLTEERRALPGRNEAESQFRAIERLRDAVERAALRLERLDSRDTPRAER